MLGSSRTEQNSIQRCAENGLELCKVEKGGKAAAECSVFSSSVLRLQSSVK